MLRNLIRTYRFSVTANQKISWRHLGQMIQILIYSQQIKGNIIYVLNEDLTFADMQKSQLFQGMEFGMPKSVDINTKVVEFLIREEKPLAVEVKHEGEIYYLRNLARSLQFGALMRGLENEKGIYKLTDFELDMGQVRTFLTTFYLRLQVQAYCKNKGYSLKSELTASIRQEILSYLSSVNETDQQSKIALLMEQRTKAQKKVVFIGEELREMENEADRVLKLYRMGIIGLTAAHLGGFGYMIFGVDWLGWDIIQPLTFSVSTLYGLLALRFYRKFNKDRSQQTIRDRLRDLALRPHRRMHLNTLRLKHQQQLQQLQLSQKKLKLAKNRLALTTTLLSSII